MVDEKSIFFMGFLERLKKDAYNFASMEPEGPVVGPADQVVGIDVLDNTQWTSHALVLAKSLPKCSDTGFDTGFERPRTVSLQPSPYW